MKKNLICYTALCCLLGGLPSWAQVVPSAVNQPPGSPGLANVDAGASGSVTSGINGLGSFGSATITGPNAVTITNSYNVAPTTSTLPGQGSTLLLQNTTLGNDTVINSANNLDTSKNLLPALDSI